MQKSKGLFLISLVCIAAILVTGCTNSGSSPAPVATPAPTATVTTTVVESPITSIPILTATPSLVTTNTPSPNVVSTIATPVSQTTKMTTASDPKFEKLELTKLRYGISDCVMKLQFPEIANDPDYGITSGHTKLVGISNEKWEKFYQDVITGKKEGQSESVSVYKCKDVPIMESTTWDFAFASAKLTPRNAKPSDYMIIFSINANGKTVAQIITNETLTIDQSVTLGSNIPIKRTEIDRLDSATLNFNRLTNN